MAKKTKKSIKDRLNAAYVKMKGERAKEKSGCDCGGKGCSKCSCG